MKTVYVAWYSYHDQYSSTSKLMGVFTTKKAALAFRDTNNFGGGVYIFEVPTDTKLPDTLGQVIH